MSNRIWGDMTRAEQWFAVQLLVPPPGGWPAGDAPEPLPYFEATWQMFLEQLPDRAMAAQEFAKLAYFTGIVNTFEALATYQQDAEDLKLNEAQYREALEPLYLEAIDYLHAHGIKLD